MPTPFSVPAALRGLPQGQTFSSPQFTQAGFTSLYWELDIPNTADYENAANSVVAKLVANGVESPNQWTGGHTVVKGVVDPAPATEFDLGGYPDGTLFQVFITVTAPQKFLIGIKNGLLS